ncbi:MAG: DinB family protein [Niabella sp.]|nr:DinB family protein [Niabella sp.]
MEAKSKLVQIVIPAFRMHTQNFNNAIDGIAEADALKRIEGRTNHIAWMAGNLVNCRYWLANILGITDTDPNEQLFKEAKALEAMAVYPTLDALKQQWHIISPKLFARLLKATDEELLADFSFPMMPSFVQQNKLNMVGMGIDRESYLFGQIGLMRRILDYPGMKYEVDESINY